MARKKKAPTDKASPKPSANEKKLEKALAKVNDLLTEAVEWALIQRNTAFEEVRGPIARNRKGEMLYPGWLRKARKIAGETEPDTSSAARINAVEKGRKN